MGGGGGRGGRGRKKPGGGLEKFDPPTTEGSELTDPSELLSERATLSPSVGEEEGRSAGKPAAPRGAPLGYEPVGLLGVTEGPGRGNTAAHSGAGISGLSNMVNRTGAARAARIIRAAHQSAAEAR